MKQLLHLAKVIDNEDPENQHRVKLFLVNRPDDQELQFWARVAQPFASSGAGIAFRPEVDDEVIVAFDRASGSEPIVLGSLYSGNHEPPEASSSLGNEHAQVIKTKGGHEIALHDGADGGIAIRTNGGNKVEIDDGSDTIKISTHGGSSISIDAGGKIKLSGNTIELTAPLVNIDSPMINCSGTVKATTVITDLINAATYTPGAGNVW